MKNSVCVTGLAVIADKKNLVSAAAQLARRMNAEGNMAPDLFAFRCPENRGRHWHLSRHPSYEGKPNLLVHKAAPLELQQWAMTGEMPDQTVDAIFVEPAVVPRREKGSRR